MHTSDHFSSAAQSYQQFRPSYPAALFDWLGKQLPANATLWDVGCGSGQASSAMADRGWQVVASDLSAAQLNAAKNYRNNPVYIAATAEQSPLRNHSVDAVTVAQAAHWFELTAFYKEARRVLKPNGLLALWGYERPVLMARNKPHPELAKPFADFHANWLKPWWPAQRQHVDNGYRDLLFPYDRLSVPTLRITRHWTLPELLGYAASWSATNRCQQQGSDPIAELNARLAPHWPTSDSGKPTTVAVHWPLFILAARIADERVQHHHA